MDLSFFGRKSIDSAPVLFCVCRYFPKRYVQEKAHGMMREFVLKFAEKKLKERLKAKSKEMGIIHAALREYPNDPFWATVEGKDIDQISLKDVYHSKMSD